MSKRITYSFYDIQYETDGEAVTLPDKMKVTLSEDEDPSLEGASIISDRTGFLVESFQIRKLAIEK